MACNCIAEMNTKLADHNTRLSVTFGFPRDGGASYTLPTIGVEKVEKRKRVGPALAIPGYCPFCGTSYARATGDAALRPSTEAKGGA